VGSQPILAGPGDRARIRLPRFSVSSVFFFFGLCLLAVSGWNPASAQPGSGTTEEAPLPHRFRSLEYFSNRKDFAATQVIALESGKVLNQRNPTLLRAPASLVKMMTILLAVEAVREGIVSFDDIVTIDPGAPRIGGSGVGLRAGEEVTLLDLTKAMIIASANDAALAVAFHISGDVSTFVERMNIRAAELGMVHTWYLNPHGLDGWETTSVSTARDQAVLARELLQDPKVLQWSSSRYTTIRGSQIIRTTNRLLGKFDGVDGLKTGYTGKAGYCLAATAERDGFRVLSILLGASSNERRFSETAGLLTAAFRDYQRIEVVQEGRDLNHRVDVLDGLPPEVRLVAGGSGHVVLRRDSNKRVTTELAAVTEAFAPVDEGRVLGTIEIRVADSLAATVPAVAVKASRKASFWERLGQQLGLVR